jgi:ribosomal protein S18 acetylase RimI-like enzyme
MKFQIIHLQDGGKKFEQVIDLLFSVFVGEGFTKREAAKRFFTVAELMKRGEILVAEDQSGEVLGIVTFVRPESSFRQIAMKSEAEIHLLAVSSTFREMGIGAKLVKACIERAQTLGYSKIVLSTQPSMKAAHRLYEVCGFTRNSSRDWSADSGKSYWVFEKVTGS